MAAVGSLHGVSVEPQSGSERSESGGEDSDSSESSSSSSSSSSTSSSREEKGGGGGGDAEPMEVEEGELQEEEEDVKADPVVELGAELVAGRRYENKAGAFITGIDVNSKEAIEKKEKRAQRFHFCDEEKKKQKDMVLDKDMMKKAVPNLRLEALCVSGVDDMSTQEVFDYFKEYPPAHIEWIDDTSCNVVWLDDVTSSRALINCSRMPDPKVVSDEVVPTETEVKGSDEPLPSHGKERPEKTSDDEEEEDEEKGQVVTEGAESAAKAENNTDVAPPPTQTEGVSEADRDPLLSLQQTDGVSLSERDSLQQTDGVSLSERDSLLSLQPRPAIKPFKGNKLFLRFATHGDRKEPGAASRSRYYMKYGNPNYGGMKGILSNSWKRRYHNRRNPRDVKNKSPLIGDSPPYTRTHSADLVNLPEEDEDDEDDEDDMESDDRTVHFKGQRALTSAGSAGVRLRSRGSSSGSDSEEMDYDLQRPPTFDLELKMTSPAPSKTGPSPKKTLKMTMYADQLVSSARSESRLAGGLRGRIGGGGDSEPAANKTAPSAVTDIRQLLEEKRRHPVAKTDKTDVRQRLGKRRYHDRRSSSPEDTPPPREPTRRYREDTPPPREPIKGKRRYHDPDTPPQPREPTRDVHSRLGVASQESRGLHSDWSKDRKHGTSRLWSRLGPSGGGDDITSSSSSRRRKEAEPDEKRADPPEQEAEEEEELQRMWGAMISKKQQRAGATTRGSRGEALPNAARLPSSRGSRLDQLPSLQIEISREEESSDDDI